MPQFSKEEIRRVYSEAYFETVKAMIQIKDTHSISRKELHRQAMLVAEYKTFMMTGVHVKKFILSKSQRHQIYHTIGQGIEDKSLGTKLKATMLQGMPEFGTTTPMLAEKLARGLISDKNGIGKEYRDRLLRQVGVSSNPALKGAFTYHRTVNAADAALTGTNLPRSEGAYSVLHRALGADGRPLPIDPSVFREAEMELQRFMGQHGIMKLGQDPSRRMAGEGQKTGKTYDRASMDMHTEYELLRDIKAQYDLDDFGIKTIVIGKDPITGVDITEPVYTKTGSVGKFQRRIATDSPMPLHDIERQLLSQLGRTNAEGKFIHEYVNDPAFYNIFDENLGDMQKTNRPEFELRQLEEQFRADLMMANDIASNYTNMVNKDRGNLLVMKKIMDTMKKQKTSLIDTLQDKQFIDSDVARHVLRGLDKGQWKNENAVIARFAGFVRDGKNMFLPVPLLESQYMSSRLLEDGRREIKAAPKRLSRALDEMIANIHDRSNTDLYGVTNLYRRFIEDYRKMHSDMRGREIDISVDNHEYANFGQPQQARTTLLDAEEEENLRKHTTQGIQEQDFREQVAKESRDLNADERMSSGRTRIRNRILEEMEKNNSSLGEHMKSTLLRELELNAASLTVHATDDSQEAIARANDEFASRLYSRLVMLPNDSNPFKGLTRDGLDAIIEGWDIDRTDIAATRARIAEIEQTRSSSLSKGTLINIVENKKLADAEREAHWRHAAYKDDWLVVPGRSGRHRVVSLDGTSIQMRAEHIVPTDMTVRLNLDKTQIMQMLEDLDTIRLNEMDRQKFHYERAQKSIHDSFVELRFQHQLVNEDMKINNEYAYNRLIQLDKQMLINRPEAVGGMQSVIVPLRNILESYNMFMSSTRDGSMDSAVSRMPNFMKRLINEKMPYMREMGRGNELSSMAYMALSDAILGLHKERSIDLSDAGFKHRWIVQGKTAEEAEELVRGLNLEGRKDRIDAYIEQRVQNQMYQQFYNKFNQKERRQAGESVVRDVFDMLQLKYNETGRTATEYEPTPANVHAFIGRVGDTLGILPFYDEASRFNIPQIANILEDGFLNAKTVSYDSWMERLTDADDREYRENVQSLDDRLEQRLINEEEHRIAQEHLRDTRALKDVTQRANIEQIRDAIRDNTEAIVKQFDELNIDSYNQLSFIHDAALAVNPHLPGIDVTLPFEGQSYQATVSRKAGGELVAYVPALSREIPIFQHSSMADGRYEMHQFEPKLAYSGQVVEEITSGGGVRRSHIGDYDIIQRKGASYLTHADPSDTVDLAREIMEGGRRAVYFDMETTGLTGSTIPEHLIQPLEVYYQRGEWSKAKGDFYRKGGNVGIREDGKTVTDTRHLFIQPTEDAIAYARQIVKSQNFFFNANGKGYNVVDVLRMRKDADPEVMTNFRKTVAADANGHVINRQIDEMVDQLYFLRNIAKYSGNVDTFATHTGANDANLDPTRFAEYRKQLIRDVASALENFQINPETGTLKLFDVMPDLVDSGAEHISLVGLIGAHSDFVGDDIIMGQNVAEADVKKITGLADDYIDAAKANLGIQRDALAESMYDDFLDRYDPVYTDADGYRHVRGGLNLRGQRDRYYQRVTVPKTMYRQVQMGGEFESNIMFGDPNDPNKKYALLTQEQINSIWDNDFKILKADGSVSRHVDPKELAILGDLFNDPEEALHRIVANQMGGDYSRLTQYVDHSVESRIDGLRAWETMYAIPVNTGMQQRQPYTVYETQWQRLSRKTVDAMDRNELNRMVDEREIMIEPGMDKEERVLTAMEGYRANHELRQTPKFQDRVTIEGMPLGDYLQSMYTDFDEIERIRSMSVDDYIKYAETQGVGDLSELRAAERLREGLGKPRVIEEMFLAGLTLPDLPNRRAETIQEALGLGVAEGQHFASTDVRMGLNASGKMLRMLRDSDEFKQYDGSLLQAGDFVEHHSAIDKNLPIGVYEVKHVGDTHIELSEFGTGESYRLNAANVLDLNRKYQLGFDFIGTERAQAEATYGEFAEDQARRQLERATQSAFNYDIAEGKIANTSGVALRKLERYRELMNGTAGSGIAALNEAQGNFGQNMRGATPQDLTGIPETAYAELEPILDRIAMDSTHVLERKDFERLATPTQTPASVAARPMVTEFLDSEEAAARKAFMHDVRALETFDKVLPKSVGADLLRQMNEAIIEEGKRRGFTRTPGNVVHAGVMTDKFESLAGQQMTLDISSTRRLNQSLYSIAQRLMPEANRIIQNPDDLFITEGNLKSTALNKIIFPFLKDRGILEYDQQITMAQAIRQIRSRQVVGSNADAGMGQLQQFDAFDYLAYTRRGNDPEFIDFIRRKHEELLSPFTARLSDVQRDLMERQAQERELLRGFKLYDPHMVIEPEIDRVKFPASTISISNLQGLSQSSVAELEARLREIGGSGVVEEANLRTGIMNELFRRVTAGRPGTLEGFVGENLNEPGRMEAARVLGYVTQDADGSYRMSRDIGNMYFGSTFPSHKDDPYRFADHRINELPKEVIEKTRQRVYTKGDADSFIAGLLEQYARGYDGKPAYHGYVGDAVIPRRRVVNPFAATDEQLAQAGVNDKPGFLRELSRSRMKEDEEYRRQNSIYVEEDLKKSRERPPSEIEEAFDSARDRVKGWANDVFGEGAPGHTAMRAAKWIGGVGVAAYALKQFASAGGPLKFEHRPQGHGVEGIGGAGDNDDKSRNDNLTRGNIPAANGKAYVGAGGGYEIKAKAKNNRGIPNADVTDRLQADIGEFNVNLRDDRTTMNREWLENQMDQYVTRGHLG